MRKSVELRLSQAKKLIEGYITSGLTSDRSYRFMNDMVHRLEHGKGLSKGQRSYLDSLIEQGVPKPKNEAKVNEILSAAEVDGMQNMKLTLHDFAFKIGKGWSLSEKQEKFLGSLLAKAENFRANGRFRPSLSAIEDLENARALCKVKNGWYWQHRPGTAKAFNKVEDWLDWHYRNKVSEELRAKGVDEKTIAAADIAGAEPIIDQWSCDKLLSAVKKPLDELRNPKHAEGSIRWLRVPGETSQCVLIAGPPIIIDGLVSYPCLTDGKLSQVSTDRLKKRR